MAEFHLWANLLKTPLCTHISVLFANTYSDFAKFYFTCCISIIL